jgi:hypothetical protein
LYKRATPLAVDRIVFAVQPSSWRLLEYGREAPSLFSDQATEYRHSRDPQDNELFNYQIEKKAIKTVLIFAIRSLLQ